MAVKYKRVVVKELEAGMMLGMDVLSADDKVMLSANTLLSDTMVRRLAAQGYDSVIVLEDDAAGGAARRKSEAERALFCAKYEQTVSSVRQAFDEIRYFQEVPLKQMQDLADNALVTLAATPGAMGYLHSLHNVDNYTFQHSVNVAVICGVLSKWLGHDGERQKDFVLAGLLHDVGKAMVPLEILNKPGPLLPHEMEVMQRHSGFGHELLKRAKVLADDVLDGVLQHHERLDGTGYPRGLNGGDVVSSARIISIADIYDAMTSERVYRSRTTPFTVIRTLFADMFDKLDSSMCSVFLNNLKDYFIGSTVRLSDGRLAEVIFIDWISWDRVTVKTAEGEYVELGRCPGLDIVECLPL